MDTTLVDSKSSRTRRKNINDDDETESPRKRPRLNQEQAIQVAAQPRVMKVPPSSLHRVSLSPSPDNDDDDDSGGGGGNDIQSSSLSGPLEHFTTAPKHTTQNATKQPSAKMSIHREPVRHCNTATTTPSFPFAKYHLTGGPAPVYRPSPSRINRRQWNISRILKAAVLCVCLWTVQAWYIKKKKKKSSRIHQNQMAAEFPFIIFESDSRETRQQHSTTDDDVMTPTSPLTLRQILTDTETGYHLAMAPAFFGFYGYFGALEAWEHAVATTTNTSLQQMIHSVAGASAGAMAAILLASGISPQQAAAFCTTVQLHQFADFPGVGAIFRGNKFEQTMRDFMQSQVGQTDGLLLLLENSKIPVAVTAFDLQTMQGKILTRGSMARAARASATFPFLFQPVGWTDATKQEVEDYVFVDGGIADMHGMVGLETFLNQVPAGSRQRVINLKVGGFRTKPPGPSALSIHGKNDTVIEVISISLQNLPQVGPWALAKGPTAVEAARQAMMASLDVPLFPRKEEHHYELHIDTSHFWKPLHK